MKDTRKSLLQYILAWTAILLACILLYTIGWVAYYSKFKVGRTPQMSLYKFSTHDISKNFRVEYQWIPLVEISQNFVLAVLAAEDKNFYVHNGFSLIEDSATTVIPDKHETITQKAAHAVFLTKGDSWIKNILEPYFTTLEEYLWGKDRILEIYMNTALMGNGIFGIEAASQIYFTKSAGELTRSEAAFIAAVMESAETVDVENPNQAIVEEQKNILLKMALLLNIQVGKKPIDEIEQTPAKPIYRRNWKG